MVSTIVASRLAARRSAPAARAGAVTRRNFTALRHSGTWLVVASGFFQRAEAPTTPPATPATP